MTFVWNTIILAIVAQFLFTRILTATPISILPYPSDSETTFESNFQLGGQFISPAFTQPIDLINPYPNVPPLNKPVLTKPVQFTGGLNTAVTPSASGPSAKMLPKPGMTEPAMISTKPGIGMTKPAPVTMKPGMTKPQVQVTEKTIVPAITLPFGF